jgi:hypothetical protein
VEDETYRTAIAAEIALDPSEEDATAILNAGDGFDPEDAIAKAEGVSKKWVLEIPSIGQILKVFAKRNDVSVFILPDSPTSVFATNAELAPGKSTTLVAKGSVGSPVLEKVDPQIEKAANARVITKVCKTVEERYVLGIVLEPETADSQGDIYSHDEVRKAAHDYMENAGALGKQHSEIVTGKIRILETFVAPADFEVDGESITKGTWIMGVRIADDDLWEAVKKGSFTGFSIGGQAYRKPLVV